MSSLLTPQTAHRNIELEALQITAALSEGLTDPLDVAAIHTLVLTILEREGKLEESAIAKLMKDLGVDDGLD